MCISACGLTPVRAALGVWGLSAYSGRTSEDGCQWMGGMRHVCCGVWVNEQARMSRRGLVSVQVRRKVP